MRRSTLLPDEALGKLGTLVAAVGAAESAKLPWRDKTHIHFLRNFTIEPVEPYVRFHLLREDIRPEVTFGGYDTMIQEVLDPDSLVSQRNPDVVVLSLLIELFESSVTDRTWDAQAAVHRIGELLDAVLDNSRAIVVANTFPPPVDMLLAGNASEELVRQLDSLNNKLQDLASRSPGRLAISNWPGYLSDMPLDTALDRRFWQLSQAPFKHEFLNRYALDIVDIVCRKYRPAKKCLVLDCDDTLWGGVVGEVGIDGIQLHSENPPGDAFYRLQQSAVSLHERGIMLALCSKNNEEDVWQVLDSHPHCILDRSHLVAHRINWTNKAENIASLADELNIGLDSIVFVDNSAQECALIEELLPDVTTIRVPEDASQFDDLLMRDGLFDRVALSDEDRARTTMYQQEAERKKSQIKAADLTEYLNSLATKVRIFRPGEAELLRVAQLTQKTNQFNLTTRRYSEKDIRDMCADADVVIDAMSVSDRYGDLGIVGVMITRRNGTVGTVDTLLLSCRALGRQLEFAFVDQCMGRLEVEWGIEKWRAEYLPTRKNRQVADFWERIGLSVTSNDAGRKSYSSDTASRPEDYREIMKVVWE